ncbi:cysteine proteinase [Trichoderma novae-zelandiae]
MGPERLRRINGSATKPVDTLSVKRFEPRNEPDAPSAKRQKMDITRTHGHTSPYFSSSRAAKSSGSHDVLIDDDTVDNRSISSAGIAAASGITVPEYRSILQPNRKSARRRKSRSTPNSSSPLQHHATTTRPGACRPPALQPLKRSLISIQDSPDVLAGEDPDAGPANVVSDIYSPSSTKRDRPYRPDVTGPQFKRQRPSTTKEFIDISEDELQADSTKRGQASNKGAATSRSSNISGAPTKNPMRGDIHSTDFGKPSRYSSAKNMSISRAVCGKSIYSRDESPRAVFLRREGKEGRRLEPVSEDGQEEAKLAWLGIDLDQVRTFGISEATRCALILRSQKGDAGPKLYLEFEDDDGLGTFRDTLISLVIDEKYIDDLDKKAERAFTEAKNWIASNATPKPNSRTYTRDEKEDDAITAPSSPDRRPGPTRPKLIDSLMQAAKNPEDSSAVQRTGEETEFDFDLRRWTRSCAPSTRRRMPSPDTWTTLHPDWHESWQAPLIFPPTGKNRATVDKIDIPRLDEGEFLNDNLINFYIRYLEHKLERERPELLRKIYFFSTFFFEKLKSTKGKINYDGVKSWTAKVDLLSYDYIFVPVNENAHWYLAIICNVPNAIKSVPEEKGPETSTAPMQDAIAVTDPPSSTDMSTVEQNLTDISLEDGTAATAVPRGEADDVSLCGGIALSVARLTPLKKRKSTGSTQSKLDPTQPRIITLDSLGNAHAPTCKALKEYLIEEAKAKKGIDLTTVPTGMTARGIPEQDNYCDCGVFILAYMEEFLSNPDQAARKLLAKEELGWDIRPADIRNSMRELLFDLQAEQQKRHKQLEDEKRLRKVKKKSMAEMAGTSPQVSSPPKLVALSPPAPKIPGSFPSESPEGKSASEAALSSSESLQEANNLEGGGLKGEASNQVSEAQPKRNSYEGLRFVSPLSFDKIVVELKPPKGFDRREFVASSDDVQIMKEKSVSPSGHKGSSNTTSNRRRRRSSVEEVGATVLRPASSSRMQKPGVKPAANFSPRPPRQSIETIESDDDQPKYDGIDRSSKPIKAIVL